MCTAQLREMVFTVPQRRFILVEVVYMCMLLYIGSDNKLPIIEWHGNKRQPFFKRKNNNAQPICVREIDGSDENSKFAFEYLTKRYRYIINSWQGCGCGFQYDYYNKEYSEEYNELGKQSLEALVNYLRNNVQNDDCELFSMWADKFEAEYRTVIDLRDFEFGESFKFLEGQYINVYK